MNFRPVITVATGKIHCPSCSHAVDARVMRAAKRPWIQPGQRCPRCSSSLDAGNIVRSRMAA
jgi:hypothetical protein